MSNPATYREPIGRWLILRHDDLPEEHKAAKRAAGIDPDDDWSLIWSFPSDSLDHALEQYKRCVEDCARWETYKLVDGKEDDYIERPIY